MEKKEVQSADTDLDRAVSLSQGKYCSVYHSLREDMNIKVSYVIEENC